MRSGRTKPSLGAHDPKDTVGDSVALDRIAAAGLGLDSTVGAAHRRRAVRRVLGRDGLLQLAVRTVEAENELVRQR